MRRVLVPAGALGLLVGSAISASAATIVNHATIATGCLAAKQYQTVKVFAAAGTFVDAVVSAGPGTASGVTNAQGEFVDTFKVGDGAGIIQVGAAAFTSQGIVRGSSQFTVVAGATPCPTARSRR